MLGSDLAAAIDPALRLLVSALVAEWATRRLGSASPRLAHAAWRLVLLAAVLLPLAAALLPPVALVRLSPAAAAMVPEAPLLPSALALGYAAGVIVGAARLASGLLAVRRLRRRALPLSGDDLSRMQRLAGSRAAADHPRLVESDALDVPATVGSLSPVVVLPAAWRAWSDERLAAVLRHELAHVERRDYALNLLAAAVRIAWWWHPAAWLMVRRLSLTAELICDARASEGRGAVAYADDLLSIARRAHASAGTAAWVPGAASALTARIDALLQQRARAARGVRVAVGLATAITAVAVVATLPLRVAPFAASASSGARPLKSDPVHDAAHALRHGGH